MGDDCGGGGWWCMMVLRDSQRDTMRVKTTRRWYLSAMKLCRHEGFFVSQSSRRLDLQVLWISQGGLEGVPYKV